jgi:hypothetical protein
MKKNSILRSFTKRRVSQGRSLAKINFSKKRIKWGEIGKRERNISYFPHRKWQ